MRRTWVKVLCVVLLFVSLTAGVLAGAGLFVWYDNLWGENFFESGFCWQVTVKNRGYVYELLDLYGEEESQYTRTRIRMLEELLDPEANNFRFLCTAEDGSLTFGNVEEDWEKTVYQVSNYPLDGGYYTDEDGTFTHRIVQFRFGVTAPLTAEDEYARAQEQYEWIQSHLWVGFAAVILCAVAALVLLILLLCAAGRRFGREGVVLSPLDRIPYDLYLCVAVGLGVLLIALVVQGADYLAWDGDPAIGLLWIFAAGAAVVAVALALLLTTAVRIKARTLLRNTVIWRILKLIGRGFRAVWRFFRRALRALPMVWRVVVLFAAYLLGGLLTTFLFVLGAFNSGFILVLMIFTVPAYHGLALYLLCRWALQWKGIRMATGAIVSGQPDAVIDTAGFYPDMREHAAQLNGLGHAIDQAVVERMKSERFKTELITNVSHDLKTPLTSIISYVDLLKKEDIDNPAAREYIDVLDRKSQRLKKLTEDLVEASKASTGALTVNRERLDAVQLIRQALGEYEEKLGGAGLTLVTDLPGHSLFILADGRHVWRVLDNLLNNCVKYAMEGTRVYLNAAAEKDAVTVTVRNISREALNIPAQQLVERFVRGDESRTTEGSGLGLSIARSLTELQGGQFTLDIDGDLFKVAVSFPMEQPE